MQLHDLTLTELAAGLAARKFSSRERKMPCGTAGRPEAAWGTPGDIPILGDWNGDGKADFTVWRPTSGVWFTQYTIGGTTAVEWGINGDRPIGRVPGT